MKKTLVVLVTLVIVAVCVGVGTYFYTETYTKEATAQVPQDEAPQAATNQVAVEVVHRDCNTALLSRDQDEKLALPFTCRAEIGIGEKPVDITVIGESTDVSSGVMRITRNGQEIFVLGTTEKNMVDLLTYVNQPGDQSVRYGTFQLKDVTYDGYNDLVVLFSSGAYNFTDSYYAYDPGSHTFKEEPILTLTNGNVDLEAKTARSFYKGRGIGDIYTRQYYEFRDGKYVLVMTVSQDMEDWKNEKSDYVRVTAELKNGKMVETERKNFTQDEIWQH